MKEITREGRVYVGEIGGGKGIAASVNGQIEFDVPGRPIWIRYKESNIGWFQKKIDLSIEE